MDYDKWKLSNPWDDGKYVEQLDAMFYEIEYGDRVTVKVILSNGDIMDSHVDIDDIWTEINSIQPFANREYCYFCEIKNEHNIEIGIDANNPENCQKIVFNINEFDHEIQKNAS